MKYTEKQINQLLEDIYSGAVSINDLPVDLYNAVSKYFISGLHKFEKGISKGMYTALTDNLKIFSGAKVYNSVREMSLLKDDATIKSLKEFKEEASKTFDQYYSQWAETEYKTTIGQGQMVERWEQIMEQSKSLPFLKYSAVIDDVTSDICEPLDGICLPVDDDFWDTNSPLNHFNCRCSLEQLDKEDAVLTKQSKADEVSKEMDDRRQPLFNSNPYKDKAIFDKEHPYFDLDKQGAKAVIKLVDGE